MENVKKAVSEITRDWKCSDCGADLNKAVKLLGEDAFWFHRFIHERERDKKSLDEFKHDISKLVQGLKYLRDGGFGCRDDAQDILDSLNIGDY